MNLSSRITIALVAILLVVVMMTHQMEAKRIRKDRLRQFLFKLYPKVTKAKEFLETELDVANVHYLYGNRYLVSTTRKRAERLLKNHPDKIRAFRRGNRKISKRLRKLLEKNSNKPIEMNIYVKHNGRSCNTRFVKYNKEGKPIKKNNIDVSLSATFDMMKKKIPSLKRLSKNKWYLKLKGKLAKRAATILKSHHHIHFIEPKERFVNHGFEEVLSRVDPLSEKYGSFLSSKQQWVDRADNPGVQKMWKRGFTGKGEILGIGDTGINTKNCMFLDDQGRTDIPTVHRHNFKEKPTVEHSKIHSYYAYADSSDIEDGHGSHVSGVAIAKSQDKKHAYMNGIQYDSKVAFLDIGTKRGLSVPGDLTEGYFPYFKAQGAKIVSNSWGSMTVDGYTSAAREVDQYLYDNPDMLILFAAGNSGRSGDKTLTSPGISKNSLTVGASQGNLRSFIAGLPLYSLHLQDQFQNMIKKRHSPIFNNPAFCKSFDMETPCPKAAEKAKEVFKKPSDYCKNSFTHKMICTGHLEKKIRHHPYQFGRQNMATFSSRGPTHDRRIKPDLVVNGQPVFSARSSSSDSCPVPLVLQGTSQATPLMAGYAGMIRQYFKQGYYPSGESSDDDAFEPTGALIKATLLASAQNMNGSVDLNGQGKWAPLSPKPSNKQGFGLVDVTNVLTFKDENDGKFLFQDSQNQLETGDKKTFCFAPTNEKASIKATLTWMDYAPHPSASVTLVNDLDMKMEIFSEDELVKRVYPNERETPDRRNNVEQIDLDSLPEGADRVKITIKGHKIPHGPSGFAF
eukprot:CAMPEP_0117428592 /NCGR_PEP_ID=MMETSP0758-20121206/8265_1 /TAXON_ID=63605 /ORGANISM="Percolomonas cosmopolitus, Strain AE-1 (ATCC 50343)" /LENGTH=791 /DNA_ID=CAMNT_0005215033 /DNA_START=40 /DNA_END=2412 /DNA_ORIENTATION=+